MSTTKIEKDGIACLNSFIIGSNILDPIINSDDKIASWDGNIIVYSCEGHNNRRDKILGKVPVQIKSSKEQWKNKESFRLDKIDLENYLNDGGIVLIRPMYLSGTNYRIFAQILFPTKIKQLLTKNPRSKSATVKLESFDEIIDLENLLKHFIQNRKYQFNLTDSPIDEYLNSDEVNFKVSSLSRKKGLEGLFSDNTYIYINDSYNINIPTPLQFSQFKQKEQLTIKSDNKIYFKNVVRTITKDEPIKVELNSSISINMLDDEIRLDFKYNESTSIYEFKHSIDFLTSINKNGFFFIEDHKVECKMNQFNYDSSLYETCSYIIKLFELLRVKEYNIKIKAIANDKKDIYILVQLLLLNKTLAMNNAKNPTIIKDFNILGIDVFIISQIKDNEEYDGHDLMASDIGDFAISIDGRNIKCSRFIGLFKIDKEFYKKTKMIVRYRSDILDDLKKNFDIELIDEYINLIIELIKSYDYINDKHILELSLNIIDMIYLKGINGLSLDIIKINHLQIKHRTKNLSDADYKDIIKIKTNNSHNIKIQCCTLLLLNSFEEFKISFESLNNEDQKMFMSWPIYKLFKDNYTLKVKN